MNAFLLNGFRYCAQAYPSKPFCGMNHYLWIRFQSFHGNRSQERMRVATGMSSSQWLYAFGFMRLEDLMTSSYLNGKGDLPQIYRRAGRGKSTRPVRRRGRPRQANAR